MTQLHQAIKEKSILQLTIPGSHDSAMYKEGMGKVLGPDTEPQVINIFNKVGSLPGIHSIASSITREVISRWSRTQSLDLIGQLDYGVRYLDLRIAYHDGDFHATHTLMKASSVFEDLLKIKEWLVQHELEVVIIDFQHFYALDHDAHKVFSDKLMTLFSRGDAQTMLVDRTMIGRPIGEFLARKQQVIILYGDDCPVPATGVRGDGSGAILTESSQFWPRGTSINSIWVNKRKTTDLIPALSAVVAQRTAANGGGGGGDERIWVLQGVLTADSEDIKQHANWSLKKFGAEHCNATLSTSLPNYFHGTKAWIILMDFVEIGDWIQKVIDANK